MTEDFDWRVETVLKGTVSRVEQWVRGDCQCGAVDVLLYDTFDDPTLFCASCARMRAKEHPRIERCDDCGRGPAWRDPITRANAFYCATCHGKRGTVFQNRWATAPRESKPLGVHPKAVCTAAGYGTECKGEVKPRGGQFKGRLLCNKHAGKQGVGPNG